MLVNSNCWNRQMLSWKWMEIESRTGAERRQDYLLSKTEDFIFEGNGGLKGSSLLHYQLLYTLQPGVLCSVSGRRQISLHLSDYNYVKSKCPSISLLILVIIQKFPYRIKRKYTYPSMKKDWHVFVSFITLINIFYSTIIQHIK